MVRVGRGQVNARKITASGSLAHLRLSAETAEEVLYLSFPNLSLIFPYSLPVHDFCPGYLSFEVTFLAAKARLFLSRNGTIVS